MTDFFRPEVLLRQQRSAAGGVLVVRPLSATVLTAAVLAVAIGVVAWLSFGSYATRARLEGFVAADAVGTLHLELFATAATVRSLHADQRLRLRHPTFAGPTRSHGSGAIVAVSPSPVKWAEMAALPTDIAAHAAGRPVYRVLARLDPPRSAPMALAAGTKVSADVQIERRRLIEWLLAPSGRAPGPV